MIDNPLDSAFTDEDANPLTALNDLGGLPSEREMTPALARTARIAAVANTQPYESNVLAAITERTQIYTDMLKRTEDDRVRNENFQTNLAQINAAAQLSMDTVEQRRQADPLTQQLNQQLAIDEAMRDRTLMEATAIDRILELEAVGDTPAARLMLNKLQYGGPVDVLAEFYKKQAILNSIIQEMVPAQEQDVVGTVLHNVLSIFGPYYEQLGKTGNVQIPDLTREIGDFILGGQRVTNESSYLYSLDSKTFERVVRDEILPQVRNSATTFGFYDRSKEIGILRSLVRAPDITESNIWQAADIASFLPYGVAYKVAKGGMSLPSIAKGVGARNVASDAVAEAATKIATEGDEAALRATGITRDEVVDNTAPTAVNPIAAAVEDPVYDLVKTWVQSPTGSAKFTDIKKYFGFSNQGTREYMQRLIDDDIVSYDPINRKYRLAKPTEDGGRVVVTMDDEKDRLRKIFQSDPRTQRYLEPPPESMADDLDDGPPAKLSLRTNQEGLTVNQLHQMGRKLYGDRVWTGLLGQSKITIVRTFQYLPKALQEELLDFDNRKVRGVTKEQADGSFNVYLIADNVKSEADFHALMMHEVGVHGGMKKLFGGDQEWVEYLRGVSAEWRNPNSKYYNEEYAYQYDQIVRSNYVPEHKVPDPVEREAVMAEEALAFTVEVLESSKSKAMAALLRTRMAIKYPGLAKTFSPDDFLFLAANNIQRESQGRFVRSAAGTKYKIKRSAGPTRTVSINATVNKKLAEFREIEKRIKEIVRVPRLTEEETQAAIQGTIKQVQKEMESIDYLKDVQPVTQVTDVQLASGSSFKQVQFTVGEYVTREQAQDAAMDLGVGAHSVVKDAGSDLYHVQFSRNVRETGFFTPLDDTRQTNILARYSLGARQLGARILVNQGQAAGNASAKIMRELGDYVSNVYTGLAKDERGRVEEILAKTEAEWKQTPRYPDDDEIDLLFKRQWNRVPTDKERTAIHLAKELNDLDYAIRNDEIYKIKVLNGQESVTLDVAGFTAKQENAMVKEDWNVGSSDLVAVADAVDGLKVYSKLNPLSGDKVKNLKSQGYVMVRFEEPVILPSRTAVQAVLVKKSELIREPLKRKQLGYAGPHRMYDAGGVFAKQASIGTNPDGLRYFKMPKVFATGTRAEINKLVSQLEAARKIYMNALKAGQALDPRDLDGILPHWFKSEEFLDAIEGGMIQPDMPFRAMNDREVLPEYISFKDDNVVDFRHENEPNDVMALMRTQGQMFVSGKGERLVNWKGEAARIVDPFKTIDLAMRNIASMSSFSDYKVSAMERWYETYGGYLIQKNISPGRAISEGIFDRNLSDGIRQQAEAEREVIKRTLNWQTEWDRQIDIHQRKFFDWVMGSDPTSKRHELGQKVQNWWSNTDPVGALKMLATDLYLGLFNPAQIVLQLGTMIAATTINPRAGMQGMYLIRPLQSYLSRAGTEQMLDVFVQRGLHTTAGFASPEEFKAFMRTVKNSGFTDVERSHYWMNEGGFNAVASVFSADGALRRTGRVFLNETERANRIVASRIAYDDLVKQGFVPGTDEFTAEFFGKAEEYALSMSTQSAAAWQRGALSVPTQFWAYNARMLELMMGKGLTKEQKIRLIAGQFLLYGSAGVPLLPLISEELKAQQGAGFEVGSWQALLDRGMLDNMIYYTTGQDVLVSKRLGTGGFIGDTVKDMFGWGQFGPKSFAEITLGVSGGLVTGTYKTVGDLLKYSAAEATSDQATTWAVTRENLMKLASTVSTVSNFTKAYMVYKYGTYRTKNGTLLADDVPTEMAFAVALGFQPGEVDMIGAGMSYLKNEGKAVDEAAKVFANFRTRWAYEPDNRADIEEQVRLFSSMLPPDVRAKAIRKATQYTPQSTYDSVVQQIEEDKAEEAAYNEEGNNQ